MLWGKRGKSRTREMIALVGALVMLLACPAGAAAKRSQPARAQSLFGTTINQPASLEEYQRMAMGGLGSVRLLFFPGVVEPKQGTRYWAFYDGLVGDAARGGITIEPLLLGTPSWLSPNPTTMPIQSPAQVNMWFGFVRDLAIRYGPGGTFWAQHRDIPAHPIVNWEVWNEPNINEFAGGTTQVKAREFAKLLRISGAALRSSNRPHRLILGGLYRRPKPGHGVRMTRFLQRLYKLKQGRSLFDAVAIHPYAARPKQILSVASSARRVMDANSDGRTPIWITEVGWTTGGNYWEQSLYRATLDIQAFRIRRTARVLLANRRALHLRRVDWHTWRDLTGADDFWDKYMGLFSSDGTPKPAWAAFTSVTGGVAGGKIKSVGHTPLPPSTPPPGGGSKPPPPPKCLLPGILC